MIEFFQSILTIDLLGAVGIGLLGGPAWLHWLGRYGDDAAHECALWARLCPRDHSYGRHNGIGSAVPLGDLTRRLARNDAYVHRNCR